MSDLGLFDDVMVAGLKLVCAVGLGYLGWWAWPTGILDIPISSLTLGLIGKAVGSFVAWMGAISACAMLWL